jgi:hypothetical protein
MPFSGHEGEISGVVEQFGEGYDSFVEVAFVAGHAALGSSGPVFGVAFCWGVSGVVSE